MRRLIESLAPDDGHIYWRWVGGMFALYMVVMVTAAGMFIRHESARNVAHENAATMAADSRLPAVRQASVPMRQVARVD